MSRRSRILLILTAIGVFLVVSGLLARALSVDGAERAAITSLLDAEARGDSAAMIAQIYRCAARPTCRRRAMADAAYLRRPGEVLILELNPSAGFSFGATVGTARVAWQAGSALPIVQCVRVRRAGSILSGYRVQLLRLSVRIKTDAACPSRY